MLSDVNLLSAEWKSDEVSCAQVALAYGSQRVFQFVLDKSKGVTLAEEDRITLEDQRHLNHFCPTSPNWFEPIYRNPEPYWSRAVHIAMICERTIAVEGIFRLHGEIITQEFFYNLVRNEKYSQEYILATVPLCFKHNRHLYVTTQMLFRWCDHSGMLAIYLLDHLGNDEISREDLLLLKSWSRLPAIIRLLSTYSNHHITLRPTELLFLLSLGKNPITSLLLARPEREIWNTFCSVFSKKYSMVLKDVLKIDMRQCKQILLFQSLQGANLKESQITPRECVILLKSSDKNNILQYLAEWKPELSSAAVRVVIAYCRPPVAQTILQYRRIPITKKVLACTAKNVVYGSTILRLLKKAESRRQSSFELDTESG